MNTLNIKLGHWLYNTTMATEAWLYGFNKRSTQIGAFQWHWYDNAPQPAHKPVLVLLHGFSADKSLWLRFARRLARYYRILIPDLAGHGDTGYLPDQRYQVCDQGNLLLQWLSHLGIDQCMIAGNSMGGQISAWLVANAPERFQAAILFDPSGLYGETPSTRDQALAQGHNVFLMQTRDDFNRFYPLTMAKPPFMPSPVLDAIAQRFIQRRQQLAHIFKDFVASPPPSDGFANAKVPVMLAWGALDQLTHVSAAKRWRTLRPTMPVVVWDDLGHMPMLEAPSRSAKVAAQFLREGTTPA